MDKCLRFILIPVFSAGLYLGGYGQAFDPFAVSGDFPTGSDVDANTNEGSSLDLICGSCFESDTINFSVLAEIDGTDLDNAIFEWVVYGGEITGQSGTVITGPNINGSPTHVYLRTQGIDGASSWIDVKKDNSMPDTAWVAVRQTSEFGCSDGFWSVWLMAADTEDPVVSIPNEDTWTNRLVAISPDGNDISVDLTNFEDSIGASSTYNFFPLISDNCEADTSSTINGIPADLEDPQTYTPGFSYVLSTTATDCQSNDTTVSQTLYVYNASDFDISFPADSVFLDDDCNPGVAAFTGNPEFSRLSIPVVSDWTVTATTYDLNSDQAQVGSTCRWTQTGTYTVTYTHDNLHNSFDATYDRTYNYVVDNTGPSVAVNPLNEVFLDATGNATATTLDVIFTLSDDCTDSADVVLSTLDISTFVCSNLGTPVTVNFTATDRCGQFSNVSAEITVLDNIFPSITCPSTLTVDTDAGECDATFTPTLPTFSDNCGVDSLFYKITWPDLTQTFALRGTGVAPSPQQTVPETTFPVGTTTITYTAKDVYGNESPCSFQIIVEDNVVPALSNVPANVDHLAWELRNNFDFTIPDADDVCGIDYFTMTINSDPSIDILAGALEGTVHSFDNLNPLSVGLNTVRFEYGDGTNNEIHVYTIYVDYRPQVSILSYNDPECIGSDNGDITVSLNTESGTNRVLEYSTDNFATSTVMTGTYLPSLVQGTYYFRVSIDVNGYTSTSAIVEQILSDPPIIGIVETITPETCLGDNDGMIDIVINYVTDPVRIFSLSWDISGPGNTGDPYHITGLGASVCKLTVTDDLGCDREVSYTLPADNGTMPTITDAAITVLSGGVANFNVDAGECDVEIIGAYGLDPTAADGACVTGVTLEHDYTGGNTTWSDPATLVGAKFDVGTTVVTWTATDATGNTATTAYTINVTDNINPGIDDQTNITYPFCEPGQILYLPVVSDNCGIASVTLSFTVLGVTTVEPTLWWPHIYAGELVTTEMNFNTDEITTVTWTVTDVNGNSSIDQYDVDFTTPISTTASMQVEDITCNGETDGEIVIDFTGGTPNYTVTLGGVYSATGITGASHPVATVSNLVESDYDLWVTDADGCSYYEKFYVVQPQPITFTINTQTTNTCFESNTADLEQDVDGGNGGFSYTWTLLPPTYAVGHPLYYTVAYTFDASEDQNDMPTGNYTLLVTDSKACTGTANYEIISDDSDIPDFDFDSGGEFTRNTSDDDGGGDCTYGVQGAEFDPYNILDNNACDTRIWHDYAAAPSTTTLNATVFESGTHSVTWHVYDLSGNGTDTTITIEIIDDENPVITCPSNVNAKYTNSGYCYSSIYDRDNVDVFNSPNIYVADMGFFSDECPLPANALTYIRSDNFSAGLDDPFYAHLVDDTITWTITDYAGNRNSCKQLIRVVDNQDPTMFVKGSFSDPVRIELKDNGLVDVFPYDIDYGTTDNCTNIADYYIYKDGAVADNASISFSCSDIGTLQHVYLVAVDDAGNRNSLDTWLEIFDVTPPEVTTKPFTISVSSTGTDLLPSDISTGVYSDICDGVNVTLSLSLTDGGDVLSSISFDCSMIGSRTVYLVAEDQSGNRTYKKVDVEARDESGPEITLIWNEDDDFPLADVIGATTLLDPTMFATATDCSPFSMRMEPEYVDCDDKGKNNQNMSVELFATDINGKESSISFNLRVRDLSPPVIVLNSNDVTLVNSATTQIEGSHFVATVVDNCSDAADLTYGLLLDETTFDGTWYSSQGDVNNGSWAHGYKERFTFDCRSEDDEVTFWVAAIDEAGNGSTEYQISTSIRSDLSIEGLTLDLCGFTPPRFDANNYRSDWVCDNFWMKKIYDENMYNGIFRPTITRGASGDVVDLYDGTIKTFTWSATENRIGAATGDPVPTFGYRDREYECSKIDKYCNVPPFEYRADLGGYFDSDWPEALYTYANCISGSNAYQTILLEIEDDGGCHASAQLEVYEPSALAVSSSFTHEVEACRDADQTYTQPVVSGTTYSWTIVDGVGGTEVSANDEETYTVNWDDPTATSGKVRCDATSGGCTSTIFYNVTINDLPSVSIDPASGTNICPLTDIVYTATATGDGPFEYNWEYTGGTAVLHGDLYPDVTIQWDQPIPGPTGVGAVDIEISDVNGCTATATTNVTIGDGDPPFLNLPATFEVGNNPGDCEGAVLMVLTVSDTDEGTDYTCGDACSDLVTVRYCERYSADTTVDWSTSPIVWGAWVTSSSIVGNYAVGRTQVQWEITDISGNVTTDEVEIIVRDSDAPRFDESPSSFSHLADANCEYTHAGSEGDWDMLATDNCGVDRIWVTFSDDGHTAEYTTVVGHNFQNSVTDVTWHAIDDANNEVTHTYQVNLTDNIYPVFAFVAGSEPSDNANFNYEGTFMAGAGDKFYIFSDGTPASLSIPANITDNCGMGDVTVTLTHYDDLGSTVSAPVTITPVGNVYTYTFSPDLGQSKIVWNYDDATDNHDLRVTQYVVYANNIGFGCNAPAGWDDATTHCNPTVDDFVTEDSSPVFPGWFDYLNSNNVLRYNSTQTGVLGAEPAPVGCEVLDRERTLNVEYTMQIQNNPVNQLTATGSCIQQFDYTVDNTGPVILVAPQALILECNSSTNFTSDITNWRNNYAGIDPSAGTTDISDDCSGSNGFTITDNYDELVLAGTTCGSGSITTVTFTVTDDCGQSSDYTANIEFIDTNAPDFPAGMPTDQTVDCNTIPVAPDISTIISTDDCDPNPAESYTSSTTKNIDATPGTPDDDNYEITRVWTITDACGNSDTHTQIITVVDNDPPVWNNPTVVAPSTVSPVDCNDPIITTVPVLTTLPDCDVNLTILPVDISSDRNMDATHYDYYNYEITRKWSVQDNTSPAVEYTQVIEVADVTAPVIVTEPSDQTIDCRGLAAYTDYDEYTDWLDNHGGAIVTDDCTSLLNLIWSNTVVGYSDECGNTEYVEVRFTVSDPSGRSSTTNTATFTIQDISEPVITGTLPNLGPYSQITNIPAPYNTIAAMELVGVTIDDGCSDDANLTILSADVQGVGDCTFPVTREYTITDECTNTAITTLTQVFTIKDNIRPVINVADTRDLVVCADDDATQSVNVGGLALLSTEITDNCSAVGNITVSYKLVHQSDVSHSVDWTSGLLPDPYEFFEGKTEVHYRLSDENNNRSNRIDPVYIVEVKHLPFLSAITSPGTGGSIGNSDFPLRYSTHTYEVVMDDVANIGKGATGWEIYASGDRTSPFTVGSDYSIDDATSVSPQITFDGNLAEGDYELVFTEESVDGSCTSQQAYAFTLGAPFDVDILPAANTCPEADDEILIYGIDVDNWGRGRTSTIDYTINFVSPVIYQNNWSFDYNISITETGGGVATTIVPNGVTFSDNGDNSNLGATPTTESGTVNVSYNSSGYYTNSITMSVEYYDIHGTEQQITISLSNITGTGNEVDLDVATGGVNETTHLIRNLPLPQNVNGVN